eukprot:1179246-Prorocentrum_minimum.AAC.3
MQALLGAITSGSSDQLALLLQQALSAAMVAGGTQVTPALQQALAAAIANGGTAALQQALAGGLFTAANEEESGFADYSEFSSALPGPPPAPTTVGNSNAAQGRSVVALPAAPCGVRTRRVLQREAVFLQYSLIDVGRDALDGYYQVPIWPRSSTQAI